MTRPARTTWSHDGVELVDRSVGDGVRLLQLGLTGRHRVAVLGVEEARALRDVVTAWLGDGGHLPPADPCAIRAVVQRERRALLVRDLAGSDAVTEAAWAMRALAAVELTATERPTTTDRSET